MAVISSLRRALTTIDTSDDDGVQTIEVKALTLDQLARRRLSALQRVSEAQQALESAQADYQQADAEVRTALKMQGIEVR